MKIKLELEVDYDLSQYDGTQESAALEAQGNLMAMVRYAFNRGMITGNGALIVDCHSAKVEGPARRLV